MFAPLRPIEDHPYEEVRTEVLEAMKFTSSGEQDVAWRKRQAPSLMKKPAGACCHKIEFIARVGLLGIHALGREDFHLQRAMPEDRREGLAVLSGDGLPGIAESDVSYGTEFH